MVGARTFDLLVPNQEQSNLSRCPGVSYDFSCHSQIDKFGQVLLTSWEASSMPLLFLSPNL